MRRKNHEEQIGKFGDEDRCNSWRISVPSVRDHAGVLFRKLGDADPDPESDGRSSRAYALCTGSSGGGDCDRYILRCCGLHRGRRTSRNGCRIGSVHPCIDPREAGGFGEVVIEKAR